MQDVNNRENEGVQGNSVYFLVKPKTARNIKVSKKEQLKRKF